MASALDAARFRVGENANRVITHIAQKYEKRGFIGVDRAYNNLIPESFQDDVRRLGYKPIYDYKRTDLGVQAVYGGAPQIEGFWYCPGNPHELVNANKDFLADKITHSQRRIRVDARVAY